MNAKKKATRRSTDGHFVYAKPYSLAQHILQTHAIIIFVFISEEAVGKENQTYCDSHNYVNITWPVTSKGETALSPCPGETRGAV